MRCRIGTLIGAILALGRCHFDTFHGAILAPIGHLDPRNPCFFCPFSAILTPIGQNPVRKPAFRELAIGQFAVG